MCPKLEKLCPEPKCKKCLIYFINTKRAWIKSPFLVASIIIQMSKWVDFLLPALPVQQGSRSGSHQFILFTHKDLATSESGFSSEDICTTARNPPHTWYVLKSSAICTWTWVLLIEKPTLHIQCPYWQIRLRELVLKHYYIPIKWTFWGHIAPKPNYFPSFLGFIGLLIPTHVHVQRALDFNTYQVWGGFLAFV